MRNPKSNPWRKRVAHVAAATLLVAAALVPAQGAAQNFLWKATRGQGIVYLVGSVHLLTKDYYPLSSVLDSAFKESDLLVEEVDIAEMTAADNQLTILMRGMLPADQSLEAVVSPATFALVSRRVADLGLPVEPLKRFKPWMLALTLLSLEWLKAGFDPDLGLDKHFYDRARAEGKAVQGLETLDFQISRFDGMTPNEQDRLLAQTLKELDTQRTAVTTLANAWKAGDSSTVERIVLQDVRQEPQMYQRLLVDRNRNWLPKIEALFAHRVRAFVLVGAAHLARTDGLISMLRARGYTVEQM